MLPLCWVFHCLRLSNRHCGRRPGLPARLSGSGAEGFARHGIIGAELYSYSGQSGEILGLRRRGRMAQALLRR